MTHGATQPLSSTPPSSSSPRTSANHPLLLITHDGSGAATGFVEADAEHPHLNVHDLGVTRGDGIFETYSIGRGHVQALDAHLDRFARSARMLDLPQPDLGVWRDAVLEIGRRLADHEEAWVRTILTRGIEGHDMLTGWAQGRPAPDYRRERTEGLRVALLDRGLRSDVAQTSPWLLAGAKTLSYAVNRAAVREAQRRGADDVVFVSSDGFLLEGPNSTVVLRRGSTLSTPPVDFGILPGTTQGDLFAAAPEWGHEAVMEPLTPDDLHAAEAAWIVSSVRHVTPIRAVDGVERPIDASLSAAWNGYLHARLS